MITKVGFGDIVALAAEYDGWPAGTVGRVRSGQIGVALVEILDASDHTLDLVEIPYDKIDLVRRPGVRTRRAPVFEQRPQRP